MEQNFGFQKLDKRISPIVDIMHTTILQTDAQMTSPRPTESCKLYNNETTQASSYSFPLDCHHLILLGEGWMLLWFFSPHTGGLVGRCGFFSDWGTDHHSQACFMERHGFSSGWDSFQSAWWGLLYGTAWLSSTWIRQSSKIYFSSMVTLLEIS